MLDKGRSVGGRLATRRIGDAALDHGAQFFTVRGDAFRTQVDDWLDRGRRPRLVPRLRRAARRLPALLRHLRHERSGQGPRVRARLPTRPDGLRLSPHRDRLGRRDRRRDRARGRRTRADQPGPAVLGAARPGRNSAFPRSCSDASTTGRSGCSPCSTAPSAVPDPGGVQFDPGDPAEPFGFIADNAAKGISSVPAITFHATQPWSLEHWDDDAETLRSLLLERAGPWIGGAAVVAAQVQEVAVRRAGRPVAGRLLGRRRTPPRPGR